MGCLSFNFDLLHEILFVFFFLYLSCTKETHNLQKVAMLKKFLLRGELFRDIVKLLSYLKIYRNA